MNRRSRLARAAAVVTVLLLSLGISACGRTAAKGRRDGASSLLRAVPPAQGEAEFDRL